MTTIDRSITLLTAADVERQLKGRERALIDLVQEAYITHYRGDSRLPQSEFLRFPGLTRERIIPKAGYLGGAHPSSGIKWIASFPDNVQHGMPRASAVMILNSTTTGRPTTVMEGSLVSGQRTAAGAALAARLLHEGHHIEQLGVVGCGPINSETVRFICADGRPVKRIALYDLDTARMNSFTAIIREQGYAGEVVQCQSVNDLLAGSNVTCMGTSAVTPTITTLSMCQPGSTVLHTSLRDFTVEAVLEADNLADDVEHVLQANTSVHLAEQRVGNRDFMRGNLAQVALGEIAPRTAGKISLYSPFGLAALDLAFGEFVARKSAEAGAGIRVDDFLPA